MKQYITTWILNIILITLSMPSTCIANNLNATVTFCDATTCGSNYGSLIVNLTQDNSWGQWNPENGPQSPTPDNYDAVYLFIMMNDGSGWEVLKPTIDLSHPSITSSSPTGLLRAQPKGIGWMASCYDGEILTEDPCDLSFDYEYTFNFVDQVPYNFDVKVFAFEMVQTGFGEYLGDGDGSMESENAFHSSDNFRTKVINSSVKVDVNPFDDATLESGIIIPIGGGITGYSLNFPHEQGYVMKYEITQGAYRDFLNTLTYNQQVTRTANPPTSAAGTGALTTSGTNGNFIEIKEPSDGTVPAIYGCDASGNNAWDEAADGDNVACNFLSWMDIAAWLDWAGMGPMTETQYESICRGNWLPSPGEYAWGYEGTIHSGTLTITNPYQINETVDGSTTDGNANYSSSGLTRPLRNGIFATSSTDRTTSGAAYWGVMEMSGNLNEACVTVGNSDGRNFAFNGTSSRMGDGVLSANGNALVNHWPGNGNVAGAEVTTNSGTIARGGAFNTGATKLSISDRSQGPVPATRTASQGGRGMIF